MTRYIVHIFREMRVTYGGIEADTPEAAAALARLMTTDEAYAIEECDGDDLSALVDVAGDEGYVRSLLIDFEAERARKAAWALLSALKAVLPYADDEYQSLLECWKRDGDPWAEEEAQICGDALAQASAAISAAEAAGVAPGPDVHALLAVRRQVAAIWGVEDVQEIRPDLTDGQAWEVLQAAERRHDAAIGINRDLLACHAGLLFGAASEADEAEGAWS